MPSPDIPKSFKDLEIHVLPRRGEGYPVDLILDGRRQARGHLAGDVLPWTAHASGVPAADGCRLFEALLADGGLRQAWGEARRWRYFRRLAPGPADPRWS
jgi:hypothetical protein